METKTVAVFEKNTLNDSIKNINCLMDKYNELKTEKDQEELKTNEEFILQNRSLANNLFLYFNHMDPNLTNNEECVEKCDSLDEESDDLDEDCKVPYEILSHEYDRALVLLRNIKNMIMTECTCKKENNICRKNPCDCKCHMYEPRDNCSCQCCCNIENDDGTCLCPCVCDWYVKST